MEDPNSPILRPIARHSFKANSRHVLVHRATFQPSGEIFALADIEGFKSVTAFHNGFDADSGDADTTPDRQLSELQ